MNINDVNQTINVAQTSQRQLATSNSKDGKELGKQDFLNLLMTQMSHQDPMDPMNTDSMMQQMASLGTVEQLQNLNAKTDSLLNYQEQLMRSGSAGFLGKDVEVQANEIQLMNGASAPVSYELVGDSKNIVNIKDQIEKISVTESRIFINGPSGSGKELIARKIHKNSKRKNKPFVIINGALLDNDKYDLELFGEEKSDGSISYGALEKANNGTLLVDQVSEIPLAIQSKILRVLTDQKFKRVNGNNDINVNVRLICSSSKDLKQEIELGNFREDLFHRLNVFEINIKPLSERISDIPLLIKYFSDKISKSYNIKNLEIDENNSYILNHDWHGNVRELRNLIERIAILQPESKEKVSNIVKESLKNNNFGDKITENSLSIPLKEAREKFEKEYLTIQLKKFNGNISKTANFVGMERSALHRKLKGLGIKEFN